MKGTASSGIPRRSGAAGREGNRDTAKAATPATSASPIAAPPRRASERTGDRGLRDDRQLPRGIRPSTRIAGPRPSPKSAPRSPRASCRLVAVDRRPLARQSPEALHRSLPRGDESVAASGKGLDEARPNRRIAQRFAQPPDGRVQAPLEVDERVVSPELMAEAIAGDQEPRADGGARSTEGTAGLAGGCARRRSSRAHPTANPARNPQTAQLLPSSPDQT